MYLEKAKALYLKLTSHLPEGCEEEEVRALEQELGTHLPEALREFLLWMVPNRTFMDGSDWGCWAMRNNELTETSRRVLQEWGSSYKLPEDALVILFHQAAFFYFIRLSEGDNPPVYFGYFEENVQIKEIAPSFSVCVEQWIESHIRWEEKRKQWQNQKIEQYGIGNTYGKPDLQALLNSPEGSQRVQEALHHIEERLQKQGRSDLLALLGDIKTLSEQGRVVGLDVWALERAPLPDKELIQAVQGLERAKQAFS